MKPEENKTPKSTFNSFFIKHNNYLNTHGFKEWIFYPGMLFQDMEAWWTDNGLRPIPHEGIDLCFYTDNTGQVRRIDNGTKIPVMYSGDIVHIHDDFLGKSIYVKHNITDKGNTLHSVYGHTVPAKNNNAGKTVYKGDIIATISPTSIESKIPAHVHITTAWLPEDISYNKLNWVSINNPDIATLRNPLDYINIKYATGNLHPHTEI